MFELVYCELETEDKACFVENGSFYVALGYQAEVLSELIGLEKTCFSNGKCKVGFPILSFKKYIDAMEKLKIPYVIYTCRGIKETDKVAYRLGEKCWKKQIESEYQNDIFKNYDLKNRECNFCPYKKRKVVTDILACERRILNLKKELRLIEKVQADAEIKELDQIDVPDEEKL